ncbi:MAG: class I SAM-dependent methyltransferase [Alphaproteobacteria bacterium]|jgi:trans-aconitate methyltransferase|nr:class I SAM-dependent methyltransferase [Alphaproteobacteria bacterium]
MPEHPSNSGTHSGQEDWNHHWDHYSRATRSNPAQALRRRLIRRLLGANANTPGATIIDIGCGSGDLLAEMARHFPRAAFAGTDLSDSGLAETARKLPDALLQRCDLTIPDGAPDDLAGWASLAVCSEVLEHVDDPAALLANIVPCLKPTGRLVVTVPGGPMSAFDKHLGHRRHFTKTELSDLLEGAGLQVEIAAAAGFPTFNLYRWVVIARGDRLVDDVNNAPGLLARTVMAAFDVLLRASKFDAPWGWQIVASARKAE